MEARPKELNEEQALACARKIAEQLKSYGIIQAGEVEDSAKDIAEQGDSFTDGYELAKALENHCGWTIDAQTVEVLDGYGYLVSSAVRELQKLWAEREKPPPPLPLGARVVLRDGKQGAIDGIYEHGAAQYTVNVDGTAEADNTRRIINFEDAKAA